MCSSDLHKLPYRVSSNSSNNCPCLDPSCGFPSVFIDECAMFTEIDLKKTSVPRMESKADDRGTEPRKECTHVSQHVPAEEASKTTTIAGEIESRSEVSALSESKRPTQTQVIQVKEPSQHQIVPLSNRASQDEDMQSKESQLIGPALVIALKGEHVYLRIKLISSTNTELRNCKPKVQWTFGVSKIFAR